MFLTNRQFFMSLVVLKLAVDVWSHLEIDSEDYYFPLEPVINFCKMSEQCQHDYISVCGQDSLGITRLFNDNCDLYEYNCDDKKRLIVIGFAAEVCSHVEIEAEDYFFPLEPVVNFCKMADHCPHDFVHVCGQDSNGVIRKFNDNCDLFEYNCDEKSQYHHVKMDICAYDAYQEKKGDED